MAQKSIEVVAIMYFLEWIKCKKMEKHGRNNSSRDNIL